MKRKALLFFLALVAMLAFEVPVAFAQEPEPEAPLTALFTDMAKVMPIAILMGLLTSLLGYLKQTPPESFELDKFLATAIISVLMGILTLGFGWDYTTAQEWSANGAITLYIYRIAKIIAIKAGWIKLPQTTAYTTNIAIRNWRVSTAADMMTKLPFFRNARAADEFL